MLGTIHGDLRWIFALVALLGIARAVYGLLRGCAYSHLDARLALTYSMLLDLQALYGIGLILYLALGKFSFDTTVNWITGTLYGCSPPSRRTSWLTLEGRPDQLGSSNW
jgi:hypothetical protein